LLHIPFSFSLLPIRSAPFAFGFGVGETALRIMPTMLNPDGLLSMGFGSLPLPFCFLEKKWLGAELQGRKKPTARFFLSK
jgi:hypothetical protein